MTQRRICQSKFLRPRGSDDVSIVKTVFKPIHIVDAGVRQHSLWEGSLSNGREQFVASIAAPRNMPSYTKAFPTREEAYDYFKPFLGKQ